MKINKFKFYNKALEWSLESIDFDRLTLLVGASGVGKTQILKAILDIQRVANGESVSGINWLIDFDTINGQNYKWEGEFENKGEQYIDGEEEESKKNKPVILKERLVLNRKEIIRKHILIRKRH